MRESMTVSASELQPGDRLDFLDGIVVEKVEPIKDGTLWTRVHFTAGYPGRYPTLAPVSITRAVDSGVGSH